MPSRQRQFHRAAPEQRWSTSALQNLAESRRAPAEDKRDEAIQPPHGYTFLRLCLLLILTLLLNTACKKSPDSAAPSADFLGVMNVGKSQYEKGDAVSAVASFQKAVQQQPTSIDARLNLANALLAAGQPDKVFEHTQQVLGMDPLTGAAHYLAGCAYLRQGKFEEALKSLQQAKDIDKTVNEVSFQLGIAYEGLKNYDDAITQWRETIEFGPEHPAAYYRLSQALIRKGATDEAQQMLEKHREVTAGRTIPSDPSFFEQCLHTRIRVPFVLEQPDEKGIDVKFVDVTTTEWLPGATTFGGPIGLIDFQRTGQPALLLLEDGKQFRLMVRTNGQFRPYGNPVPATKWGYTKVLVGDLDNDRYDDAIVLGMGGVHVLKFGPDGKMTDRTLLSGLAQLKAVDGQLVDLDFTSKLSLVVTESETNQMLGSGVGFFRNLGNVMFKEDTAVIGLPTNSFPTRRIGITDLNKDDLPDVVVTTHEGLRLFLNQRGGTVVETNFLATTRSDFAYESSDLNNDLRPDQVFMNGTNLVVAYGGSTNFNLVTPAGRLEQVALLDYDNDGWLDVCAWGFGGLRLMRNLGEKGFKQVWEIKLPPTDELSVGRGSFVAADLDNDCDTDIVVVLRGQIHMFRNDGGNQNRMVKIKAVGNRSNASGIGTRFEFAAGNWRGMRTVRQTPLEVGIGQRNQIDSAFVQWTQLRMNVEAIKGDECRVSFITEIEQKQMTSCPYLYAWDGKTFRFVSDFLAAAPVGLPVAPGKIIAADPEELLWIGDDAMFPAKDGKLVLKLTEELSELLYLDEVKLVAVDHPVGMEVFSTSKMLPSPPWLPHEFVTLHKRVPLLKATSNTPQGLEARAGLERRLPVRPGQREEAAGSELSGRTEGSTTPVVTDAAQGSSQRAQNASPLPGGKGQGEGEGSTQTSLAINVTERLQAIDNLRVSPEIYGDHLRGWAKTQEITLDFGALDHTKPLVLALNGWLRFGGAMANIAASQRDDLPFPFPTLAVETGDGTWQTVDVRVGTPAGRTKSIIVDLTGKLPAGAKLLKLTHAFELHWDRIALFEKAGESTTKIARVSPSATDFQYRGFSEDAKLDWTHPTTPIHDQLQAVPHVPKVPTGWATRFGPVDELVAAKDNAFVLINGGDALTVEFDASELPPKPAGHEREFFLWSVGWDKDTDYYTVLGDQIEPLPWHGMDDQTYGQQPRPGFASDELMKKFTTRWVGPRVPTRREVAGQ